MEALLTEGGDFTLAGFSCWVKKLCGGVGGCKKEEWAFCKNP